METTASSSFPRSRCSFGWVFRIRRLVLLLLFLLPTRFWVHGFRLLSNKRSLLLPSSETMIYRHLSNTHTVVVVSMLPPSSTHETHNHNNKNNDNHQRNHPASQSHSWIDQEIGVLPPVGFFDPWNVLEWGWYGDKYDNFRHYRSVELKHGRIAMAATLGMLVQENYRFTGYISPSRHLTFRDDDIPNGWKAIQAVPVEGWIQIIVLIGLHELLVQERNSSSSPGDFGTGYFGVSLPEGSPRRRRLLNVEISNGRLAMLGILGMLASEQVNHGIPLAETHILEYVYF